MRVALVAVLASGCRSLLGFDDVVVGDAGQIADADPDRLTIDSVSPAVIFEGTGSGGGRKGMLVVHGTNIVRGATISVSARSGPIDPSIDLGMTGVADDGRIAAVAFTSNVNPALDGPLTLEITITQAVPDGEISRTLTGALVLQGLDELTTAGPVAAGAHEFSTIDVDGALTGTSVNGEPVILRAHGAIRIQTLVSANANGQVAGPGGGDGGTGGSNGSPGGPGVGDGAGRSGGGGGGFGVPGGAGETSNGGGPAVGSRSLPVLAAPNRGSGGAGGNAVGGGTGGAGGGGGGTIELTAGGSLVFGTVEARGAAGKNATNNEGGGGGGSGGAILLRGNSINSGIINVGGGLGGSGGSQGGNGGSGRIRIDTFDPPPTVVSPSYHGPVFALDTPLVLQGSSPTLTVAGEPNSTFQYTRIDEAGQVAGPFDQAIDDTGIAKFPIMGLAPGLLTVCVYVEGAVVADARPEARNCIDLVVL